MKVISRRETVILTATEKAILEKAFEIFDDIAEDCTSSDGLCELVDEARDAIADFLNHEDYYIVELPTGEVSKVVVEITL